MKDKQLKDQPKVETDLIPDTKNNLELQEKQLLIKERELELEERKVHLEREKLEIIKLKKELGYEKNFLHK
ncbi:6013_t:CDS:2 [Cetraspora pellucida]|uniref:6013_t:CDS:1 n=1 Tax=Cetraspora pellucida TaxID=1433469 RepID=A0ACA9KU01_9GLOM|nr:6013_t:CDS:2 [Cetraspora pellucida]